MPIGSALFGQSGLHDKFRGGNRSGNQPSKKQGVLGAEHLGFSIDFYKKQESKSLNSPELKCYTAKKAKGGILI